MFSARVALSFLLVGGPVVAQQYTISTFAGGGLPVNVLATSASLGVPQGVAADEVGNVFFTIGNVFSASGITVLRVDAQTGMLTVVAGNGPAGFSGGNGPATSAQLGAQSNFPSGIAVDSAGNLYIADTSNNRIRKVSNGVITIARNSMAGMAPTQYQCVARMPYW
jgi:hypothetical protein